MPDQVAGINARFALYNEAAYNTALVAPEGWKLYLRSFGLRPRQNRIDSQILLGVRSRSRPTAGNKTVEGDLVTEIAAESIGPLLRHAMGDYDVDGGDPYTHTLGLGDLPAGMLLEKDHGSVISGSGRFERYSGCKIGKMSLVFPQEGYPLATFSVVGAAMTPQAAILDASGTPWDPGHASFSAFEGTMEEGGSAIATVTAAKIDLDNDLDDSSYAYGGAGIRRRLKEGFATVSGELTALFEDYSLLTKAIAGTETSLKVVLQRGTGAGSDGNEYIEFLVQQMLYEMTSAPIEGPRGLQVTLPFKGYASEDLEDPGLIVTIKNAVPSIFTAAS